MKAVLFVLLSACAIDLPDHIDVQQPEGPPTEEPATIPPTVIYVGPKDQGKYLLSETADGLAPMGTYHAYTGEAPLLKPNAPNATRVRAMGTGLTAYDASGRHLFTGAHSAFVDMTFNVANVANTQVRIAGVSTSAEGRPLYQLELIQGGASLTYCGVNGGGTYATPGRWKRTGEHDTTGLPYITFTCHESGVIAKCESWGYPSGTASNGLAGNLDPWMVHQACTRMARADRCGNGVSRTFEGTSILIRDAVAGAEPNIADEPLLNPTVDPPPIADYYLEAGWNAQGVVCLSRVRWKGLPLSTDECSNLIDPRGDGGGTYCEDMTPTQIAGLMFENASRVGQLYLNLWTNGSEYMTTVRGTGTTNPNKVVPPMTGYTFVRDIGLLMINPPASITALNNTYFYEHTTTRDRVLAPSAPTPSHALLGFEGHLHQLQNPTYTRIAIRLFRNNATGDHVAADAPPPTGMWEDLGPLGFVEPRP